MRIIVTGATGFIGKNFISKAAGDKNHYVCLVRKGSGTEHLSEHRNVTVHECSFTQGELLGECGDAEVVIHMAGRMGGYGITREQMETANCALTKRLVDACARTGVRQFIYLSTPGVQGFGNRLCTEEAPYNPRHDYEKTKVQAEEIIMGGFKNTCVSYTVLRPDFVYGPEDYRRVKMYRNIRGRKFVLTTPGDAYLNPTYVLDVVQGIQKSVGNRNAENEIFNISSAEDITVEEYLGEIAKALGVSLIHLNIGYPLSRFLAALIDKTADCVFHREGFVSKDKIDFLALDHSTSCLKARELLGYKPEFDFKSGIGETLRWCKKNNLL